MATVLASTNAKAQLRPLRWPDIDRGITSSGLGVLVARRGPLPLVTIRLVVHSGSAADPKGLEGLTDFTTELLRRGTRSMSADQINEAVEFVGGSLAINVAEDYAMLGVTAPSEHFEVVLNVLADMVSNPTFPEREVEMARRRVLAQLANDFDDPALIAERALLRATWGDHPYGHDPQGSKGSVSRFGREALVAFHREHFGPRNSTLVVVGDVEPTKVMAAAERAFAQYSGARARSSAPMLVPRLAMEGQVLVVDKPDLTQTQMRIVGPGTPKGHPDYFRYAVMNSVLGGGFTSRLVTQIRVKRGLSYGALSYFHSLRFGGTFGVSSFTKTESTRELVDVALGELERMREKGPKAVEVRAAQTFLNGIFPARVETNEGVAGHLIEQVVFGQPDDWVERYRERIAAISVAEVADAARRHLPREGRVIVLVGNASLIVPQLKGLGPVTVMKAPELE